MGQWHTRYVVTSPLKMFKSCYIIGGIFGIFAVVSGGHTVYSDKALNLNKWKGILIGALIQSAVLALVYVFCNVVDALPLGIILFASHIAHLVLFGIFFGKPHLKNTNTRTNITPLVYRTSLKTFMDMFCELAEEMGKVDNFEKNCHLLKAKVELLQSFYGYALQNLQNRDKILTAIAFYHLFNVDGFVYIYTRQETTNEQFADIVQLIIDALDDENLDDDIDFVMKDIVDGYFMYQILPTYMKNK